MVQWEKKGNGYEQLPETEKSLLNTVNCQKTQPDRIISDKMLFCAH